MNKNIIKIDKKSDINKFIIKNNKYNKYELILKNNKYELFFKYGEFLKINNRKLTINEIQNYGGWISALRGLIKEIWLKDIENKNENEILIEQEKLFKKGIKNNY